MRLMPREKPVVGKKYKWLRYVPVWKQGELDYTCGPVSLLTAALLIKAIRYEDCDFKYLAGVPNGCSKRALTKGVSFSDIREFAITIQSMSKKNQRKPSPGFQLKLDFMPETFPKIEQKPKTVWLLRTFAQYLDPYRLKKTEEYDHILVVLGEEEGHLLVADPHPWSCDNFSWINRKNLGKATAPKGWPKGKGTVSVSLLGNQ